MNHVLRLARHYIPAFFLAAGVACGLWGCGGGSKSADQVKIGFIVKQPEETWFQNEWKFAQKAADQDGFTLIKIGAPDGDKVMAAIDNLAAQGAKGFVICTPDTHLGPAIKAKADQDNLKLISVDDQFIGADGNPMDEVHHLGISAHKIGLAVGKALYDEMTHRGWKADDTALCCLTFKELATARERTDGAVEALTGAGFPKDKVYDAPQKTSDTPGGFDAANICLTQHPDIKHWLICGMNDNSVLGGVRATENRGVTADNVIAVGINGIDAVDEFKKDKPTGFFASILLSPTKHGHDTADLMYKWIHDGSEPPKVTYTEGTLITRDTFKQVMTDQGLMN